MRIKSSVASRKRRKKILKSAKGYWGARSNQYRTVKQAVVRAGVYAYRDRRAKKRVNRRLWIVRINAAIRAYGLTYSKFIDRLKKMEVNLDRKILAELAARDEVAFGRIVKLVLDSNQGHLLDSDQGLVLNPDRGMVTSS